MIVMPAELSVQPSCWWQKIFPFLFGLWLAVVFAKFGNPIIFGELIDPPGGLFELVLNSWPTSWGYLLLGIVAMLGVAAGTWKPSVPRWVLILPLVWFCWQLMSAR